MSAPPLVANAPIESGIRCIACGHDLSGTAVGALCPECATPVKNSLGAVAAATSGKAIASLVLGICSLVMVCACPPASFVVGGLGLLYGVLASGDIKRGAVSISSNGLNVAGLVTSSIGLVVSLAVSVLFVAASIF